jgi:hypothetical protein
MNEKIYKKKHPEHWILLGKPKKKEEGGGTHTIQIIEFYE